MAYTFYTGWFREYDLVKTPHMYIFIRKTRVNHYFLKNVTTNNQWGNGLY